MRKLPELSPTAAPQFVDAATCKAWLDQLPLANVASAQHDLLLELEVFNSFPASAAQRLGAMEALREAVSFVQVEQAKRFMNRPLPMAEAERAVFEDTTDLWEQMRLGYLRCLEAALGGDAAMRAQAALLTQRLAAYSGLKMFHYYRAYREVPARDWRSLHEVYAHAERLGVAEEPVKDFLNRDIHESSPRIAYARALLMGLASPQELAQRQLTFVAFLLERWGHKLEISSTPVPEEKGVPPLLVDLAGDRCPVRGEPGPQKLAEPRYLDTRKLAKSLRNRVGLLRKGESPAKLALGEDCVQPSCEQLLVFLFRQWCQARPRGAERRGAAAVAQACNDLQAIHHYIAGGAQRRPVDAKDLTQQQRQELETLGRIRTAPDEEYSNAHGFMLEEWKVDDDSPQELRISRAAGASGKRYSHGQLVAVRPGDAQRFFVGQVRWLMGSDDGGLRAGIKLMPGIPTALVLRPVGLNEKGGTFPGLALTAVAALGAPPSLVLPPGSFRPKRVLEVTGEKPKSINLTEVLDRGIDYERVAYEAA
jgi:hypothetical protein